MTSLVSRRACLFAIAGLTAAPGCKRSTQRAAGTPSRIVSITPNTTETVFALGTGDRLVGRSRYCDFPPEVERIPAVGGYVDPSLEAILALQPDLVTGARGPIGRGLFDKLEARGVKSFFPATESIDAIFEMIIGLATILDVTDTGNRVIQSIRAHLASIDKTLASRPRPRTLLVYGQSPIVVAGPHSFASEMLERAGCHNVVTEGPAYPTLGMETIVGLDPELIIDATMAGGRTSAPIGKDRPGWASIRAVQQNRVARIDDDRVMRPGPRLAEGVAQLAKAAHDGLELP